MGEIDKLSTGDPKVSEIFTRIAQWFDSIYYIDLESGRFYSMIQSGGRAPYDLPESGDYMEMIGQLKMSLVYPKDRAVYERNLDKNHMAEYLREHDHLEFEYRSRMEDGTYHWYRNMIVALKVSEDGRVLKAASLVRDIHKEKTALLAQKQRQDAVARALKEEQRRIQMLAEASNAVVVHYDVRSGIARTIMNVRKKNGSIRIMEFLRTDIDNEWRAMIHPDYFDTFLALFREGEGLGETFTIQARLRYDRTYRWYRVTGHGVYDDAGQLLRIVATLEDIHAEKQEEMKLLKKTELDPATGVLNRAALEKRVCHILANEQGKRMGVFMIIDLDKFKHINDCYGHLEGDRVICEFAAVLKRLFRSSDVIGRMGGDEFAVFFCGCFTPEQIAGRAQKVCDEVKGIMDSPGDLPGSSCSIGIAVSEDCRKSFRRLYKEADGALYNQKKHGRDGYCFFESYIDTQARACEQKDLRS